VTEESVRAILQRYAVFEDGRPVECLLIQGTPKICYASWGNAKTAAKEMIEAGLEPAKWYRCSGCSYWHLGTTKYPHQARGRVGLNGDTEV
jgi:hypothetical protein